jgi:hypothetical protein
MVRNLTTDQNVYLAGNSIISVLLIDIGMANGSTTRYTDAPYNISFNSNTYTAQGVFLGVSETEENADVQIVSATITLSALDTSYVTSFATSAQINQLVTIRRAFINFSTNQLIGDSAGENAITIFRGRISGYSVNNNVNTAEITLQVSSQFINFDKRSGRRTNQGNFQVEHPQDNSMEFSAVSLKDIRWGRV